MGNTNSNSHHAHIAGVYFCSYIHKSIGTEVYMDAGDRDTITGYSCDYQICGANDCRLKREYPIGTSDIEAARKLDKNTP